MREKERRVPDSQLAQTAKRIVVNCFRNTDLENIHAGVAPVTHSGDYSDVKVIDAEGTERSWATCSHIDDAEMKALMRDCVERVYTVLKCLEDAEMQNVLRRYDASTSKWDRPKLSRSLLGSELYQRLSGKSGAGDKT